MRPETSMLLLLFAVGCASTSAAPVPDDHPWQGVNLTANEQQSDPLPAARLLIDQRETPGSLDHAIALLRWHVERHPESADLHLLLAEAHSRSAEALDLEKKEDQGSHQYHRTEGLKHAQEALKLAPQSGPAHYWYATNLLHAADAERSLGRAKTALGELDQADKISPDVDEGGPSRMRGRVLHEMPALFGGSTSKAIASLKRSAEIAPAMTTTHLWLAEAYMDSKQHDLARKELQTVVNAKPRPHREKGDGADKQKAQELLKKLDAR
jgi:tetratricopeptide (TPR) repeat protein